MENTRQYAASRGTRIRRSPRDSGGGTPARATDLIENGAAALYGSDVGYTAFAAVHGHARVKRELSVARATDPL
jgi:hypothetical protein